MHGKASRHYNDIMKFLDNTIHEHRRGNRDTRQRLVYV